MTDVVLVIALVGLGILAQAYRVQRDYFIKELLTQHAWIDEIIDELEGKSE